MNSTVNIDDFTGRGLTYPIQIDEKGTAVIEGGLEVIRASLRVIFSYEYGTRYFLYEFGLELKALLEDPNDDVLIQLLEYRLNDQLLRWEPRIKLTELSIERMTQREGINIKLVWALKGTDIKDVFVAPFYNDL